MRLKETAVVILKWKSTRDSIFDQRAVLGEKDFFSKPSKVLHLTTSEIATASLNKSFLGSCFVKERKPLFTLTGPNRDERPRRKRRENLRPAKLKWI